MRRNLRHCSRFLLVLCLANFWLPRATAAPVSNTECTASRCGAAALLAQLAAGQTTSEAEVQRLLQRIALLDDAGPRLNAVVHLHAAAVDEARQLDSERRAGQLRGPLHGVPVLLKANIATADDLPTHAGSLALVDFKTNSDAPFVARLRAAGAIILGKTNLSEWANFRSTHSVSGWSSVGGQTRNPYALDRNPCGSSSGTGVAIAADFAPLGVGTETDGSIICPSGLNGLVGLKPTVGLIEGTGIIPIAHSQDTAGPMTRTVFDAALLLNVMQAPHTTRGSVDYTAALATATLRDKRIGVIRDYGGAGSSDAVEAAYNAAIVTLREQGATIVEVTLGGKSRAAKAMEAAGDAEFTVLLYEFKTDLEAWLQANRAPADRDTLAELIVWNEMHRANTMPVFEQELFHMAVAKGPLTDHAYLDALRAGRDATQTRLRELFATERLDALVAPTNAAAWKTDAVLTDHVSVSSSQPAAVAGWPSLTLPMAFSDGLPLGLSFISQPWTEASLLQLAYAFEQATHAAQAPQFLPTTARDAALYGAH
jgi:amidase